MKTINLPFSVKDLEELKAGDDVLLNGTVYTARDQAHARFVQLIRSGEKLPFELKGQVIYYCGPTATPVGKVIGSCGPTTSRRMDEFTPLLLSAGLKAMIGKGSRSDQVVAALKKYKAVYFAAYAGCGALIAQYIQRKTTVAFKELGPEAVYRLEIKDFPAIVAIDMYGKNIYKGR
jgi:fumarate hydratase subunit beta